MTSQSSLSFMADMSHVLTFDEALQYAIDNKAYDARHGLSFNCPPNWEYDTDDGGWVTWHCSVYVGDEPFHYYLEHSHVENYLATGTPYANQHEFSKMVNALKRKHGKSAGNIDWEDVVRTVCDTLHREIDHKQYADVVLAVKREAVFINNSAGWCDDTFLKTCGLDEHGVLTEDDFDKIASWATETHNLNPEDVNDIKF